MTCMPPLSGRWPCLVEGKKGGISLFAALSGIYLFTSKRKLGNIHRDTLKLLFVVEGRFAASCHTGLLSG